MEVDEKKNYLFAYITFTIRYLKIENIYNLKIILFIISKLRVNTFQIPLDLGENTAIFFFFFGDITAHSMLQDSFFFFLIGNVSQDSIKRKSIPLSYSITPPPNHTKKKAYITCVIDSFSGIGV